VYVKAVEYISNSKKNAMKSKYLVIAFGIFLFFACNKEEDFFMVIPETDLISLERMNEAYETALLYNDSLLVCSTDRINCDSATVFHYDDLFHQFDEMFDFYHENYSHNNVSDDHHHDGDYNIRHGGMMHHDDGEDHNDDEHEHNMENFELMMNLREMHEGIHPG